MVTLCSLDSSACSDFVNKRILVALPEPQQDTPQKAKVKYQ
jgi:hypothetical protein